jgi:hypothetical protein
MAIKEIQGNTPVNSDPTSDSKIDDQAPKMHVFGKFWNILSTSFNSLNSFLGDLAYRVKKLSSRLFSLISFERSNTSQKDQVGADKKIVDQTQTNPKVKVSLMSRLFGASFGSIQVEDLPNPIERTNQSGNKQIPVIPFKHQHLVLHDVPGDGNCQMHATLQALQWRNPENEEIANLKAQDLRAIGVAKAFEILNNPTDPYYNDLLATITEDMNAENEARHIPEQLPDWLHQEYGEAQRNIGNKIAEINKQIAAYYKNPNGRQVSELRDLENSKRETEAEFTESNQSQEKDLENYKKLSGRAILSPMGYLAAAGLDRFYCGGTHLLCLSLYFDTPITAYDARMLKHEDNAGARRTFNEEGKNPRINLMREGAHYKVIVKMKDDYKEYIQSEINLAESKKSAQKSDLGASHREKVINASPFEAKEPVNSAAALAIDTETPAQGQVDLRCVPDDGNCLFSAAILWFQLNQKETARKLGWKVESTDPKLLPQAEMEKLGINIREEREFFKEIGQKVRDNATAHIRGIYDDLLRKNSDPLKAVKLDGDELVKSILNDHDKGKELGSAASILRDILHNAILMHNEKKNQEIRDVEALLPFYKSENDKKHIGEQIESLKKSLIEGKNQIEQYIKLAGMANFHVGPAHIIAMSNCYKQPIILWKKKEGGKKEQENSFGDKKLEEKMIDGQLCISEYYGQEFRENGKPAMQIVHVHGGGNRWIGEANHFETVNARDIF